MAAKQTENVGGGKLNSYLEPPTRRTAAPPCGLAVWFVAEKDNKTIDTVELLIDSRCRCRSLCQVRPPTA